MTIRDTFDAFFRSILEEKDVDAWTNLWLVDDPTITMRGSDLDERADGIDAIRALGEQIAEADFAADWDEVDLHERTEVAWINAAGTLAGRPYRLTMVLLRTFAGWRVHTFSGSIPD